MTEPLHPYAAASAVGIQAGLMGGIIGCCWAFLILMIALLIGLFLFLDDPNNGKVDPRTLPAKENHEPKRTR